MTSPGSSGNVVSIASRGASEASWWPSWNGRPNSCSWCGERCATSRLPGSPRTSMNPLSPTFAVRITPCAVSIVAMHAVVLPLMPSAVTSSNAVRSSASGAKISRFPSTSVPEKPVSVSVSAPRSPPNASDATPMSRRENKPASMPMWRHMNTPSATPKATNASAAPVAFFSPRRFTKYASSPACPHSRCILARAPSLVLSACGTHAAPVTTCRLTRGRLARPSAKATRVSGRGSSDAASSCRSGPLAPPQSLSPNHFLDLNVQLFPFSSSVTEMCSSIQPWPTCDSSGMSRTSTFESAPTSPP